MEDLSAAENEIIEGMVAEAKRLSAGGAPAVGGLVDEDQVGGRAGKWGWERAAGEEGSVGLEGLEGKEESRGAWGRRCRIQPSALVALPLLSCACAVLAPA